MYTLRGVRCEKCLQQLGWRYLRAERRNKDREGTFMLRDSALVELDA